MTNSSKQKFDYEEKKWGSSPITNLKTDFQGLEVSFLERFLRNELKRNSVVVDVGSGAGNILGYLGVKYPKLKLVGIDISRRSVEEAQKRYKRIKFYLGKVESVGLRANSSDIVTFFDSLEHIDNITEVIRESRRILKPQGKLVIGIPLEKQFPSLFWILYKLNWRGKSNFSGHVNFYSNSEFVDFIQRLGFKLVKKEYSYQYFMSIMDLGYYLYQSLKGSKVEAFETSVNELDPSLKKSILINFKKVVSAISYFETRLLWWFPGGKGHYIFEKLPDNEFFSSNPPFVVLDKIQIEYGMRRLIRPKDLVFRRLMDRFTPKNAKILDFGCADGVWLERLLTRSRYKGTGVDVSKELINKANKRLGKKAKYLDSTGAWPLQKEQFDVCYSLDVFEHIEDKQNEIRKIYKSLKKGGTLIIYTLNPNNKYTFDWLFESFGSDALYKRADHNKALFPSPYDLADILSKVGFHSIEYKLYDGPVNLFWDVFCYVYLSLAGKIFGNGAITRALYFLNSLLVVTLLPINNFLDKKVLARGYSNGYFLWAKK